jgi:N-acetylglucosamine-6-phosphate deacetylase
VKKIVRALGPEGFRTYAFDTQTFELDSAVDGVPATTILVPGFVDIHFHGAFGIDFMAASEEEMGELCRRLANLGYEAFLPTTVTARANEVVRALESMPDDPMVLGFHLEGPFISPKHPGAQPQHAIVPPPIGPSEWDVVLDDPRLRVVTLAPEVPGGDALIRRLAGRGVRVSMGHTDATYDQCRAGFAAGARHTTHTYNAMRGLHHRESGAVGFALTEDRAFTELIYDRHHVSRPAADVLFRCKPRDRVIAISDSAMATGLPVGTAVRMWGLDCVVGEGTVRLTEGTLAGSAITLLDAFRNLSEDFDLETAIRACCLNPRVALGLSLDEVKVYVELDDALNIVDRYARV